MLPVDPVDERPVDAVDLGAGEDPLAAPAVKDLRAEAGSSRREDDVRQTRGDDAVAVNAGVRRSSTGDHLQRGVVTDGPRDERVRVQEAEASHVEGLPRREVRAG